MITRHWKLLPHYKSAIVLSLLSYTLIATSCGHSKAEVHTIPRAKVIETVRQYGQGHLPNTAFTAAPFRLPPPPASEPLEAAFATHMKALLLQENFAELERIANKARNGRIRHSGGVWQILDFYEAVADPAGTPVAVGDWNDTILLIKKWIAAYPESVTARLALANSYYDQGWDARGSGYANTVGDDAWKLFYQNMELSKSTPFDAATLKEKDPFWYHEMQRIGRSEGWEKAQVREVFDKATAFEPTYDH
jgi:hypothetical protein